jgi:thiamine kinase
MPDPRLPNQPLATGRTAEIFPWEAGLVLKLFRPGWGEAEAQQEAQKAQVAHEAGLPAPAVFEVVMVNGRFGILYERVQGNSLPEVIRVYPWKLFSTAHLLADLHLAMHRYNLPDLPSHTNEMRRRFQKMEGLPPDVRRALLAMLGMLPQGEALCHGDFHPGNVILTAGGPLILDWMDATCGDPLADVARSSFLLSKSVLPGDMPGRRFIQLIRGIFHRAYLKRYFSARKAHPMTWQAWQILNTAARLAEGIPAERDMLIEIIKDGLQQAKPETAQVT